ncbi:unnamed protein product [Urochloa decumbens]|uniref:HVA22-like protein n=1 Tax=Urochloa decumbens TaxID=240449 RepID=A0ABC9CE02_9POAL
MGGGGSGSFLKVLVSNLDVLAGPLVSLAYPLYASVRAIETKSAVDDQQWLTYWVLYSFITLFELTFAPVLEWLPLWSYAKLFFNCWLVLPQFNGAAHVYEHFVRPMIVNQQVVNIWYIPKKGEQERPDDVISAAQKYIEQNGSKAFENLVNKFKTSNPRRSILEEVEVERRARIQRESEAREVNPFFNPDYNQY